MAVRTSQSGIEADIIMEVRGHMVMPESHIVPVSNISKKFFTFGTQVEFKDPICNTKFREVT